jgi:hypothetical protein
MGKLLGEPTFERRIKDLLIDETGFADPWALVFYRNGDMLLDIGMAVHKRKSGTATMRVKRTGLGNGDYEVDVRDVPYNWGVLEEGDKPEDWEENKGHMVPLTKAYMPKLSKPETPD